MDPNYFGGPDFVNEVEREWEAQWAHTQDGFDMDNFGDVQAWNAAVDLGMRVGEIATESLLWIRRFVLPTNPIHALYAAPAQTRPCEAYEEAELAGGAAPMSLGAMASAMESVDDNFLPAATAANHEALIRTTNFQRHWAALVRAEFLGYWGTRAEQLCAARWLRIQLEAINVRKAHIASAIPMILSLARIPTEDEDAAAEFERSEYFRGAVHGLSWPRRLWRWATGRRGVAKRRTTFVPTK